MGRASRRKEEEPSVPRRLLIAEKPLQGAAIADALLQPEHRERGSGWIVGKMADGYPLCVTWAKGHLLEVASPEKHNPAWAEFRIDQLPLVPENLRFRYTPRDTESLSRIGNLIGRATEIVNACDAAREGELIFAEILHHFGYADDLNGRGKVRVTRMWLQSITATGITQAWHGRELESGRRYAALREAGFARAHADWIWGMSLSRLATLTLPKLEGRDYHAIGRVQTPLVFLVHDRCRAIQEFKAEPFWKLEAVFRSVGGKEFTAEVVALKEQRHGNKDTHFRSPNAVMDMKREITTHATMAWLVHDEAKEGYQYAHPPYNLLELQRACARLWKWPAAKTLALAQSLYEHDRAISYPRTESEAFPEEMRDEVLALREKLWESWALNEFKALQKLPPMPFPIDEHFDDKAVTDHHAIMPTGVTPAFEDPKHPGFLREEYQLWRLITARFLLAWLPAARICVARRILMRQYSEDTLLRAVLECEPVLDPGWLVYENAMMNTSGIGPPLEQRLSEKMFPVCNNGEARVVFTKVVTCLTTAPRYHNDDTLLGYMKKAGLGTAATRAETIQKVLREGYVERLDTGTYRTTADGTQLIEALDAAGGKDIFDPAQTEYWETLLARIEKQTPHRPTREVFLENISAKVAELVAKLGGKTWDADEAVFDPDTGKKIDRDEKGYLFPKGSRLHEVRCPFIFAGRKMAARDYCSILIGGKVGGGPFKFFSKRKNSEYTAWLLFRAKEKSFEFVFKSRGNDGAR